MTLELRPLAVGELFDRAFVLYRRHFWLFVGITSIPGVFALVATLAQQAFTSATMQTDVSGQPDPGAVADNIGMILSLGLVMLVFAIAYWIVYMVALGATTFAVSEIYVGRTVTVAEMYRRMRGSIGGLLIQALLVGLRLGGVLLGGALALALGGTVSALLSPILSALVVMGGVLLIGAVFVFLALRYSLAIPALVLEGLSPSDSIRRSTELTRRRLGRVFLMVLCAILITYAALTLFQGPFVFAALLAGIETSRGFWLNVMGAIAGTIGTTLTTPFLIIGLAVIYYDARIREEGFDLELSLAALDR
jgi:membrane-anchored glycerophosphoryl diester phosphodiesterase (GDPDase)